MRYSAFFSSSSFFFFVHATVCFGSATNQSEKDRARKGQVPFTQACDGRSRLQCGVWKLKDFWAAASPAALENCGGQKTLLLGPIALAALLTGETLCDSLLSSYLCSTLHNYSQQNIATTLLTARTNAVCHRASYLNKFHWHCNWHQGGYFSI